MRPLKDLRAPYTTVGGGIKTLIIILTLIDIGGFSKL